MYKEFVSNVEKSSINSLILSINKLIKDFENNENSNEVTEF